ncbi:Golgi-associated plant pathogenesis-related protein 1, partial [Fragariocoptes setiger]
ITSTVIKRRGAYDELSLTGKQVTAIATTRSQFTSLSHEPFTASGGNPNSKSQQYNAFIDECIRTHNEMRRRHGVPELQPSKKLTRFARRRAKHIANSDGAEFRHPDNLAYGENLAWHSDADRSCAALIKLWYDERDLYRFDRGQFDTTTGHFTQLVWKSTTRVGCAKAYSSGPRGGVYLVCNYDPPGNWVNEALENVFDIVERTVATTHKPLRNKPSTAKPHSQISTITTTTTAKPKIITTSSVAMVQTTVKPKPPLTLNPKLSTTYTNNNTVNSNTTNKHNNNNNKNNKKKKEKKKKNNYNNNSINSGTTTTTSIATSKPRAQSMRT